MIENKKFYQRSLLLHTTFLIKVKNNNCSLYESGGVLYEILQLETKTS